jgi:hypothetical protein
MSKEKKQVSKEVLQGHQKMIVQDLEMRSLITGFHHDYFVTGC